ncbi:hypothetical protein ACOMHN_027476 [Nucella lapillus]
MVTRPITSTEHREGVDKGDAGDIKQSVQDRKKSEQRERKKSDHRRRSVKNTRISTIQEDQIRLEALESLKHLDKIRNSSRNTMVVLVLLFICTWAPNLAIRAIQYKPAQQCKDPKDCWANVPSYCVASVFITARSTPSSTASEVYTSGSRSNSSSSLAKIDSAASEGGGGDRLMYDCCAKEYR